MTQEDKELLLQDLCSRLPYRVKCVSGVDDATLIIEGINPNCNGASEVQVTYERSGINFDTKISSIKPYLFPLSSMTEEQYKKWCDLEEEPLDEILRRNANGIKMTTLEHHLLVAKGMVDPIKWCYENHFDVNGLIPLGLANDATGLGIYGK